MAAIPTDPNKVWVAIEDKLIDQPLRPYLGYSALGHKCPRFLWYSFRWCFTPKIRPQLKRLFSRGDQEEHVIVKDLREAGMVCTDVLEDQKEVIGCMGHIKGHPDGRVSNVPGAEKTEHSAEFKTANDKKFNEFKKFGVERSNPQYWVQTHCYMGKQGLTRCLYIITNKNNDERLYLRIKYEPLVAQQAEERGFDIITSPAPPAKLSERPEWYECKFCNAKNECHHGKQVPRNCRTCEHSSIRDAGEWWCSVYPTAAIPVEFQRTGCADGYRPLL